MTNRVEKRKVQQRVQTGIRAVPNHTSLKISDVHNIAVLHFTNNCELWKFFFNCCGPLVPERVWYILPGVHSNAIETGYSNPPNRILNQVPCNLRIILIKVGKKVQKPTLQRLFLEALDGPGIVKRPGFKNIVEVILFRTVVPGGSRRVVNPRVIRTGVIHNLVLNDFQAKSVSFVRKFAQLCQSSKMFFYGIKILRVVAMEAGARLSFFQLDLVEAIVVVIPGR